MIAAEGDGSLTTLQTLCTLDFYLVFVPFIFAAGVFTFFLSSLPLMGYLSGFLFSIRLAFW
jgi:hypothetical protein